MTIKRKASKVFCKAINRDRPYTYLSKGDNKTKNHRQNMRLKHMESGTKSLRKLESQKSGVVFYLKSLEDCQIPERVLETIRLAFLTKINKYFIGIQKKDYWFAYTRGIHQILRLKTSVSAQKGISVDRISTGMKNSFGKFYSFALRLKNKRKNKQIVPSTILKIIFTKDYKNQKNIMKIRQIILDVSKKLPVKSRIEIQE